MKFLSLTQNGYARRGKFLSIFVHHGIPNSEHSAVCIEEATERCTAGLLGRLPASVSRAPAVCGACICLVQIHLSLSQQVQAEATMSFKVSPGKQADCLFSPCTNVYSIPSMWIHLTSLSWTCSRLQLPSVSLEMSNWVFSWTHSGDLICSGHFKTIIFTK